jgi:hypothetical protein
MGLLRRTGKAAVGKTVVYSSGGAKLENQPAGEYEPRLPVERPPFILTPLVGRREEVDKVLGRLDARNPAELSGPLGIGKSTLIQTVGNRQPWPDDGVIYFPRERGSVDDIRQYVFDTVHDKTQVEPRLLPSYMEGRLAALDLLVIADDPLLDGGGVQELLGIARKSRYLWASPEGCLGGASIGLPGLDLPTGIELMETVLEAPLTRDQLVAAERLHQAVRGHPGTLGRAAAELKEGLSSTSLRNCASSADPMASLDELTWAHLDEEEQVVLALLRLLGGSALGYDHLKRITGLSDARKVCKSLQRHKLAKAHSPRYGAVLSSSREAGTESSDHFRWLKDEASAYLTKWAWSVEERDEATLDDAESALRLAATVLAEGHFQRAIDLSLAVEHVVAPSGRWGTWGRALECALQGAWATEDASVKAWALHQLGTRAVLLENPRAAELLGMARSLRTQLGDEEGLRVTQANIELHEADRRRWKGDIGALRSVEDAVRPTRGDPDEEGSPRDSWLPLTWFLWLLGLEGVARARSRAGGGSQRTRRRARQRVRRTSAAAAAVVGGIAYVRRRGRPPREVTESQAEEAEEERRPVASE